MSKDKVNVLMQGLWRKDLDDAASCFFSRTRSVRIAVVKEKGRKSGNKMWAVQVHRYRHWLGSKFRQQKRIRLHKGSRSAKLAKLNTLTIKY